MVFIACVGQTHYKSICGGSFATSCESARFWWILLCWLCAIPGACYLQPVRVEPQTQVFFSNASNVSIKNCTGVDECRQPVPCTLSFCQAAGSLRFQLFQNQILLIHHAKLQSKAFSVGLCIPQQVSFLLVVTKAASCPPKHHRRRKCRNTREVTAGLATAKALACFYHYWMPFSR